MNNPTLRGRPTVAGFFDERTFSVQYVVADPKTKRCAIIDPVLDFDEKSGSVATWSADALLNHVREKGYELEWILDTHPHADHFSAAAYLKEKTGVPTAIGEKVVEVQKLWKRIYNYDDSFSTDGAQWDKLFADGERFTIGDLDVEVMLTPGHTLASIAYHVGDAVFVHDTLFQPDFGTARADFPGGDAHVLWKSIQRILALPDDTRVFTGHDYMPNGRAPAWESTVREQKAHNKHLKDGVSEKAFVAARQERDGKLPMPKLILQSLQVNIRGGRLPEAEGNGRRYLKIPIGAFDGVPWKKEKEMSIKSAKELVSAATGEIETLSAEEALKLRGDPNVTFVDVRESEEARKTGKIKGATHAPRGFLEFHADPNSPNHIKELGSGKRLMLYCASGNRSALAAQTLKGMGVTNVAHVAGGFPALQKAGAETEPLA